MKRNTLVLCGGTGAHVALALVRLHTLGQALGFFRGPAGEPLPFPAIYLVDQDSGDGDRDEPTAWQEARRFVEAHPGRHDWREAIGRADPPEMKIVTPLPVGAGRTWFNPPYDTLGRRFADSPWLDLLTSAAQREIRFSHGMMGSPAVGSLLFRLKDFDTKPGGAGTNHDGIYQELLTARGRVAVVGSAVGGTGASVAPTLAQRFADADPGNAVMAVMVLNWFRFPAEGPDEERLEKAQRRNRAMVQNAHSAFAYCGRTLARRVATVPIGMPDTAVEDRRYTSDTQQPIRESFIHGVAALCGLHHFLGRDPCSPGLYQMGAADPTCLGGGNRLPGRAGDDTVQSLADQAATLAATLDVFQKTLSAPPGSGWFGVSAAIRDAAAGLADPARVAEAVGKLVEDYREHLKWMEEVLRVRPKPDHALTLETRSRKRLAQHPLRRPTDGAGVSPEDAALALFHWTARWIRDFAADAGRAALVTPPAGSAQGGYWPPLEGHDALNVAAEKAGALTRVLDQNIDGTVEGFILGEKNVAQNGWPDPVAAAGHFRYAIEHEHPTELRQLEMLLAGVVMGKLALRDVSPGKNPPPLSLDHLVDEYREDEKRLPGFARVALVHEHRDGEVVLGFNAPHTLLCPTPTTTADDEKREIAWGALWQALTGSSRPQEWRTEVRDWRYADNAVRQIRAWIENEKRAHGGAPPPWTHVFEWYKDSAPAAYGRGATLSVSWGAGDEAVPVDVALPTAQVGNYWPDEKTSPIAEDELLAQAPAILKLRTDAGVTFEKVQFERPGRTAPMWGFWREHLEFLQQSGVVAAFGSKPDAHQIAFLTADRQSAAILENVVVLDRDDMMVRECTPMWQEPVPGSSTKSGSRYPDYPLRADYLGLVETDGGLVIDLLKRGERVSAPPPSIDEGSRRRTRRGESTPSDRTGLPNAPKAAGKLVSRMVANAPKAARTLATRMVDGITEAVHDLQDGDDRVSAGPSRDRRVAAPPAGERRVARGGRTAREQAMATWNLRLAGRSDVLPITLPVPAPDGEDEHHRAHWMVWPRFRSREAPYWRAYYVYQHCTYAKLGLSTLWFDPDDDRVHRCETPSRAGSHPIRFDVGRRAHTGGPPVAFALENTEAGHELGLYLINLDPLPRRRDGVQVGLDFGTSHTVASVRADGENRLVELPPELASRTADGITLHVSENWSHVDDAKEGVKALGVWLPTYTDEEVLKETAGLLPSELLTIEPLANLSGDDPSRWRPGRDCVIPFMDMRRRDLADYLLSDFKWEASFPAFREREPALREVYLGMAIELVMADVVWRRLRALPDRVDFTFTYPLRDSSKQVQDYQQTLRQVTESGTRSLGCALGLTDDVGMYNESSAAKGGTDVFGEVCLVGDLGGGTLDLFISAYGGPGIDFEEVADSAKLGGNELLRTMAREPDLFLPRDSGWAQPQLRAWMRSRGSARLFGDGAGKAERHDGLGVTGFARPAAANAARALIERYFRLVVEYMARSLVAYLVRHWYPKVLENRPDHHDRLRVIVQLRGNGWRLWHGTGKYDEIERKIAEDVQARAAQLWRERASGRDPWRDMEDLWRKCGLWNEAVAGDSDGDGDGGVNYIRESLKGLTGRNDAAGPAIAPPTCSSPGSHDANPKAAPILRVVGQAQRHDAIRSYRHALVELDLLTGHGPAQDGEPAAIRWFDRLPVRTGGEGVQVEFHEIRPPFLLSHPEARARRELPDIEPEIKRKINEGLKELCIITGVDYNAPIAALVWEAAFESSRFVKGE